MNDGRVRWAPRLVLFRGSSSPSLICRKAWGSGTERGPVSHSLVVIARAPSVQDRPSSYLRLRPEKLIKACSKGSRVANKHCHWDRRDPVKGWRPLQECRQAKKDAEKQSLLCRARGKTCAGLQDIWPV